MTEYTLSTQDTLKQSLLQFQNENAMLKQLNTELESQNSGHLEYIRKLKIDNRKRRKIIEDLQKRIDLGANAYYSCPYCDKNFINATFLQAHLARKHPDKVAYVGDALAHAQKMVNDVNSNLEKEKYEISKQQKVLEERLRLEEENRIKELESAQNKFLSAAEVRNNELIDTINALKKQLSEEKRDNDERNMIQLEQLGTFKNTILDLEGKLEDTNRKLDERPVAQPRSPVRDRSPQHTATLNSTGGSSSHHSPEREREVITAPPRARPATATPKTRVEVPKVPVSYHSPEQKDRMLKQPAETINLTNDLANSDHRDPMPPLPPRITRQDFINQLESRMKDLNLDLSMSGLQTQDYNQKMELLKQQRFNQARNFPNFYNSRQIHTNKLEYELSNNNKHAHIRHASSHSLGQSSSGYGSPTRLKSLSSQNLPESYSSILKKPSGHGLSSKPPKPGQLVSTPGPSTTTLPMSHVNLPSVGERSMPPSSSELPSSVLKLRQGGELEVVQDRTNTSTPPLSRENSYTNNEEDEDEEESDQENNQDEDQGHHSETPTESDDEDNENLATAEGPTNVTPRNERERSTPNRVLTESESEEESTAWDESTKNSRSMNEPVARSRTNFASNQNNRNRLDDEDEESSDDWMDELDKALKTQGYND